MMAKGKGIGDPLEEVARTGKIGGRPQPSKSTDIQTSETLNTQSVESPNIQQSNIPDVQSTEVSDIQPVESPTVQQSEKLNIQTSEMVKGQNMNSLATQDTKGTHKGRTQKTVYLPPRLAGRLDIRALQEGKERSDIVAAALELYFKSVPLTQNLEDEE